MRIWCYQENTGALIPSPYKDKGFKDTPNNDEMDYFLFSKFYTSVKPPKCNEFEVPCLINGDWIVKKDYRSLNAWYKSGQKVHIIEIGVEPDGEYITVAPDGISQPIWDEVEGWRERTEKEVYAEWYEKDREETIESMRHECQLILESKYYNKEIDFKGKHVRADIDSQKIITGYLAEISIGSRAYPLYWITCENDMITIDNQTEMISMVS